MSNVTIQIATHKVDIASSVQEGDWYYALINSVGAIAADRKSVSTLEVFADIPADTYTVSVTRLDMNNVQLAPPITQSFVVPPVVINPTTKQIDLPASLTVTVG